MLKFGDVEPMKEENAFKLVDADFLDSTTIGLWMQQFIAEEHLKEMVEVEKLEQA